jgi:hypothetical protein
MIISLLLGFAPAHAAERFVDNGDGTVTDNVLGLMWSQTDNHGDIDWKGAERWVKLTFPFTLPREKRDDWRLPTRGELESLYVRDPDYEGYESSCGQRVRIVPRITLSCGWVWTSEKRNITAGVFNFQRGYHYTDRMVHKRAYRALAVRDIH